MAMVVMVVPATVVAEAGPPVRRRSTDSPSAVARARVQPLKQPAYNAGTDHPSRRWLSRAGDVAMHESQRAAVGGPGDRGCNRQASSLHRISRTPILASCPAACSSPAASQAFEPASPPYHWPATPSGPPIDYCFRQMLPRCRDIFQPLPNPGVVPLVEEHTIASAHFRARTPPPTAPTNMFPSQDTSWASRTTLVRGNRA